MRIRSVAEENTAHVMALFFAVTAYGSPPTAYGLHGATFWGKLMRVKSRIPTIGLLGGVGAGKSTVAAAFARIGCAVIDGDIIGHELLRTAVVKRLVRNRWGANVFDGSGAVDRAALAARVFADPAELAHLNGILHPRIRRRMWSMVRQARAGVPAVVIDAAVLMEAGWDDLCDVCVFVKAGGRLRQSRVRSRGWSARQWRQREKSQISLDKKAARCEYTVVNGSSIPLLRAQVRQILRKILSNAER